MPERRLAQRRQEDRRNPIAMQQRRFDAAVTRARDRGCRCKLRFDGMTAVPLTEIEASICVVHRPKFPSLDHPTSR